MFYIRLNTLVITRFKTLALSSSILMSESPACLRPTISTSSFFAITSHSKSSFASDPLASCKVQFLRSSSKLPIRFNASFSASFLNCAKASFASVEPSFFNSYSNCSISIVAIIFFYNSDGLIFLLSSCAI